MAIQIYTDPQQVNSVSTITAAQNLLLVLCTKIFSVRDFKYVEREIADASKIRFGLMALTQVDTSTTAYDRIILTLNRMCDIYNIQIVPEVS